LPEKKSLIRFLVIYIFSTFLLLGIGEYFYYKLAQNSKIEKQKIILENRINNYLKQRVKIRQFKNFNILENMAIFRGKKLVASNFNPPKIDFNKEIFIKDNKIFYLKKLIRPFGEIYLLTFKELPKDDLIQKLLIFNLFAFIVIFFISLILGKIFLSPMKKSIQNLEDFITDSTHEMNTPISIIMSNIEILQIKGVENKELKRIINASKRLTQIFDNLKFIKLKKDKKITSINIKEILLDRIEYFEITPKIELQDVEIMIDKEDLIRLIDNLLSNAKKYSKKFIEIQLTKNYLLIKNDGEIKNINNIKKRFVRENQNEGVLVWGFIL